MGEQKYNSFVPAYCDHNKNKNVFVKGVHETAYIIHTDCAEEHGYYSTYVCIL